MTTFAKSTFSAASYAAFRPTYPPQLYTLLLNYHRGPRTLVLDLGAGHGLIARALAPSFDRIMSTDPSPNMVAQATAQTPADKYPNVSYKQASAEDLTFLPESSVDMIVSGQAAHWFDYAKAWPQMARVLRPGATLALWCYKDHVFVSYPRASKVFIEWIYGDSKERLGPYWEPGRQIVRQNYRPIQPPKNVFDEVSRVEYEPGTEGPGSGEGDVLMQKRMTLGQSMEYMRTWSSVHAWQEANGNPKARKDGGEGDVVDHMYDDMRAVEEGAWKDDDMEVDVEWGSSVVLARKREG
ncbi:putative Trans-aconitate 3-methyltransferase [Microthyrium microscopicum]|uniref:Putative Trans-aconitate 3-methyltransferase n=1 Tax=Microthyrium microscopicum TaxID=703497 RepID=A0A6A6ULR9_9PEZI|nr:putative Trans-aconitate 3-methyltransferase [Microthyrium microscopicum]